MSVDNEMELVDFVKCSTKIFDDAKMDLRMWTSGPVGEEVRSTLEGLNAESTLENIVPVLGIMWNRKDDTLYAESFLVPVLLIAELLLQKMWAYGGGWDTPLPENIKNKFLKWYNRLEVLSELRTPRRMGFGDRSFWSLHVFCDASQHAYATVIFLRCETNEEIWSVLWRLDSTTAIFGIRSNDAWGTFVGNRIKEICAFSRADQWSYIPGSSNPADLSSRGCSPLQFSESDWWRGPDWLKGPGDRWPKLEIKPDEILVLSERKKGVNLNVGLGVTAGIDKVNWYEKFSEFSKNDSDFRLGKEINQKLSKESGYKSFRNSLFRHAGQKQTPSTSTFLPGAPRADAESFSQGVSGTVDPKTRTERL
ncbi:uncharacterized protein TNCT_13961 [Trichonephila clavata]|uniref:Uncharacterized protein n=1 Tax=Trichonephila clavata TaxID=2740835 RepID=A0A8X6JKD7_TRICU|nr:uncharacterized protein TNCT_13961 [Trichonephila clavata]